MSAEHLLDNDGYKTDVEWRGTIDYKVFTIYNYKDGKNYLGEEGLENEELTDWHIGGKNKEVVALLNINLLNDLCEN